MEAAKFLEMIEDKHFADLKKMQYKYSKDQVDEMLDLLENRIYSLYPLMDFKGNPLVYYEGFTRSSAKHTKSLMTYHGEAAAYGAHTMENEIYHSLEIEDIHTSRESIRRILDGYDPRDAKEECVLGMKKGMEFISDCKNKITEENLNRLYGMAIGDYLASENKLKEGNLYRDGPVYVASSKVVHQGLDHHLVPEYMRALIEFINTESDLEDLEKAAVIHFFIAYVHPYFDGNGRTARMVQIWYLVQRGYTSAMFVSLSTYIWKSREKYYKVYRLIEENYNISGMVDVTPFIVYFSENVYAKIENELPSIHTIDEFASALSRREITEKEHALWNFVLNTYGKNEFSTKQLERDFGNAAYGTIRTFVQKFHKMGLLSCRSYANRPKYKVR